MKPLKRVFSSNENTASIEGAAPQAKEKFPWMFFYVQ